MSGIEGPTVHKCIHTCAECVYLYSGAYVRTYVGTQRNTYPCAYACVHSGMEEDMDVYTCTVKPVYNNHSRDQVIVVSVDRWSLYGGAVVQLK